VNLGVTFECERVILFYTRALQLASYRMFTSVLYIDLQSALAQVSCLYFPECGAPKTAGP